jgi:hypothetical protein
MTEEGLRQLWTLGDSSKREEPVVDDRPPIGKFGIGKLATYLLANRLTYVCKASDGVVRLVEMNYAKIIDDQSGRKSLFKPSMEQALLLEVRELSNTDLKTLFKRLGDTGTKIEKLIASGLKPPPATPSPFANEFGGKSPPTVPQSKTWTLAIMLSLKDAGKRLQPGRLKFMLETALPLGSSMAMVFNGARLVPRLDGQDRVYGKPLGPGLGIEIFSREMSTEPATFSRFPEDDGFGGKKRIDRDMLFYDYAVQEFALPYPHVRIGNIDGDITGQWSIFEDRLTDKKADEYGRSHGFFINVLGRVVNQEQPYFYLKNLNHTAWAHFRATVRADWLDDAMTVNRESLHEHSDKVAVFVAFLRALFNKARQTFDRPLNPTKYTSTGTQLAQSWGAIPLQSLTSAIGRYAKTPAKLSPDILLDSSLAGAAATSAIEGWVKEAKAEPGSVVKNIKFRELGADRPLFAYDLTERLVLVNEDHPVATEFGEDRPGRELLSAEAAAEILADAHLTHIGVDPGDVLDFQTYRDDMRRIIVKMVRRSAATIARVLIDSTSNPRGLEDAVTEALISCGFNAHKITGPGRTDGVAVSPHGRSKANKARAYKFSFDAKSSKNGKMKTSDIKPEKLRIHREDEKADYTLVVAPDYEKGQIETVCRNSHCTPMRAAALAKLLMLVAQAGGIDLQKFETVFTLYDPDKVDKFVNVFVEEHLEKDKLSLHAVLKVLQPNDFGQGRGISTSVIADRLQNSGLMKITEHEEKIQSLFAGLAVLVPNAVRVDGRDVWFATSPDLFMKAVRQHLDEVPKDYRLGLDEILEEPKAPRAPRSRPGLPASKVKRRRTARTQRGVGPKRH